MDSALTLGGDRVAAVVRRIEEKNILRVDLSVLLLALPALSLLLLAICFRIDSGSILGCCVVNLSNTTLSWKDSSCCCLWSSNERHDFLALVVVVVVQVVEIPFRGFNPSIASYRGTEGMELETNACATGIKGCGRMLLLWHVLYAITKTINTIDDRSLRISGALSPCIGVSDIMVLKDSICARSICFKCQCQGYFVANYGVAISAYTTDLWCCEL